LGCFAQAALASAGFRSSGSTGTTWSAPKTDILAGTARNCPRQAGQYSIDPGALAPQEGQVMAAHDIAPRPRAAPLDERPSAPPPPHMLRPRADT
jgi:hypothetical protein